MTSSTRPSLDLKYEELGYHIWLWANNHEPRKWVKRWIKTLMAPRLYTACRSRFLKKRLPQWTGSMKGLRQVDARWPHYWVGQRNTLDSRYYWEVEERDTWILIRTVIYSIPNWDTSVPDKPRAYSTGPMIKHLEQGLVTGTLVFKLEVYVRKWRPACG